MVIYQILPRLYGNLTSVEPGGGLAENGCGKFSNIDVPTLDYIKWLGCSHIYLTGILSHATVEAVGNQAASHPSLVKGRAGSPFAVRDHYDVAAYLADDPSRRMQEFSALLDRAHDAGLKVIIDFIPNHVSRDYPDMPYHGPEGLKLGEGDDDSVHWRSENDFFYYPGKLLDMPQSPDALEPYVEYPAKASGNCYSPTVGDQDWYDTIKINYTPEHTRTWDKMYAPLAFWASLGVDGFRCDMVELVPKQFFKWAFERLRKKYPDIIFIAEIYQKSLYKEYVRDIGFDLLYEKSGMYDSLRSILTATIEGQEMTPYRSCSLLTTCWQTLGSMQNYALNFLENHDEQRIGSRFYTGDPLKAAPALAASLFFNRASFMLYFGQELGESALGIEGFSGDDGRTSIFDWWTTDTLKDLWQLIHSGDYRKPCLSGHLAGYEPIFRLYSDALHLKNDTVISSALSYDLNYCNEFSRGFDRNRHFAFLRSYPQDGRLMLFVCNFASVAMDAEIHIPDAAFDYIPIPRSADLNPDTPIAVSCPAFSYFMQEFRV